MQKLNEKQKSFCRLLLKNKFNQSKAYQEIYGTKSKDVAKANASKLLTKSNVQEYLSTLSNKQEKKDLVTIEEVLGNIKKALENDMRTDDEGSMNTNGVYKGSELLGRYLSAWKDNVNLNADVNVLSWEQAIKQKKK